MIPAVRGFLLAGVIAVTAGCATAVLTGVGDGGYRGDGGRSAETYRSDARISAEVNRALVRSRQVPAMDIQVRTVGGRVTLTGRVPDRTTAVRAQRIAAGVPGVESVRNLLEID